MRHEIWGNQITNVVAIVAEKYAILMAESGTGLAIYVGEQNYADSDSRKNALDRIQDVVIKSGLLREMISEPRSLFPNVKEALTTMGLYGSDGALIAGQNTKRAAAVAAGVASAVLIARAVVLALTRSPNLAIAIVPVSGGSSLKLDLAKVGMTSGEVAAFLKLSPSDQRSQGETNPQVGVLCKELNDLDFNIAFSRGEAA